MGKTIGEKLDSLHNQQAHDYCDTPEWEECPKCNGMGRRFLGDIKFPLMWGKCETCDGTGRIIKQVCKDCGSPNRRCACDEED